MFDIPPSEVCSLKWNVNVPIEDRDWNVGLIVGPSGSGKSTLARELFRDALSGKQEWGGAAVIDDFAETHGIREISEVCQSVGFNTITAWLRPFNVLSNGEKFRVELARTLLETNGIAVVDEFTSMVDRQVAKIGSHAVQKHVRRKAGKFVAVTCHYDVLDWLQPDWVLEPHSGQFQWRAVQQRPKLNATISPVHHSAWKLFAPFHYLSADLNKSARCWCLFIDDKPTAFAGMLYRPHPHVDNIMGCSRLVTLPDFQGLGLAPRLIEFVGGVYAAMGKRVRTYPAHPALMRTFDKSPAWRLAQKPLKNMHSRHNSQGVETGIMNNGQWRAGDRPCAVFEYVGPVADKGVADNLMQFFVKDKVT